MERVIIALDAYGGDQAPEINIDGAISFLDTVPDNVEIILVGKENDLKELLKQKGYAGKSISIIDAPDVFGMAEKPSLAIRKKNTSLYKTAQLVKEGKANAMATAGNTGGVLAVALFVVGRIKGIERGAIATPIPSNNGFTVLLDSGANLEVRASHLKDFAVMGNEYARILKIENPKIGLLNVGEEDEKGTDLLKETFTLLKERFAENFVGNVEGRDIVAGNVDVIVTSGLLGNIAIKSIEGTAKYISTLLKKEIKSSGPLGLLGGALLKGTFNRLKKKLDPNQYGGAFVLGVNGVVTKAHGSSNATGIENALNVAYEGVTGNLVDKLKNSLRG
ncbi:MAG: phosphate acyltransferase PlsX [Petrotogales bacterium]